MNSSSKKTASYRELFRIAVPLIITSASFTMLHFCDRMFLSWYSPEAIQAVVPAGILSFTLISFFMALCAMANSFVAQYYGAGEYENCSRSVAQSIFMALLSMPLIWALIPVGVQLLVWSGHAPEVFAQEKIYLSILMLGGVNVPLTAAAGSFFSGRGKTRVIMLAHLVGNSVNVLFNWLLIFGHGPFPELGIKGAAIASLIAGFVAPTILLSLYFSKKNHAIYRTREMLRFDRKIFARMIRFGLPSGIHMVLDIGSFSLFVLLLGRLGETSFMASNIVLSINMIAFMPSIGMGQAASVMVGQYMGRGNADGAQSAAWKAMRVAWVYTLIVTSTFVIFPEAYIQKSGYYARAAASNAADLELIKACCDKAVECALAGIGGVIGEDDDKNDELRACEFPRIAGGKPFDIDVPWFGELLADIGQTKGEKVEVSH